MKIAFVTFEYPPDTGKGGIATYTLQIAKNLVSAGVQVHVFTSGKSNDISSFEEGVYVHRVNVSDVFHFNKKILNVFKRLHKVVNFDLVESPEINYNALLIKKEYPNLPLVVRLHAPNHLVESLKKKYIPLIVKIRFVLGSIKSFTFDLGYWRKYIKDSDPDYKFTCMADGITAPSESMRLWAQKKWGINSKCIKILHNPFTPDYKLMNIPILHTNSYKTIVFYGRLNVLKGLYNLTKAMKIILKRNPSWKFKVIGDNGEAPSPLFSTMRSWMLNEFGTLNNRVFFINGIDNKDLHKNLYDSEIIVIPSLYESFSYVCVEAMAAGKAVVGSFNGGIFELIRDGHNGLLVDPNKIKEIIDAIELLMNSPDLCFKIRNNARSTIEKKPQSPKLITSYLTYYSSIAKIGKSKNCTFS